MNKTTVTGFVTRLWRDTDIRRATDQRDAVEEAFADPVVARIVQRLSEQAELPQCLAGTLSGRGNGCGRIWQQDQPERLANQSRSSTSAARTASSTRSS